MPLEHTLDASMLSRYWAWSQERFPLIGVFSSFLLYALAFAAVPHAGAYVGKVESFYLKNFLFATAIAMHFLTLRVLDEHKDYLSDLKTHPERVLSKGIVSLKGLRNLGYLAVLTEFSITAIVGSPISLIIWGGLAFWTLLMTLEFFSAEFLKKNLTLYSISHMLVMPFLILWAASFAHPDLFQYRNTSTILALVALTFCNGLIYEILRKSKGFDEEREGVDTFSRRWGRKNAALAAAGLHLISMILFAVFLEILDSRNFGDSSGTLSKLHLSFPQLILPLLCLGLTGASLYSYANRGSKKDRKANEGASALFVLVAYLTLIVMGLG